MQSMHCKRNPQQGKIRFVAESATLLIFSDLLGCFGFNKKKPKFLYHSKLLEKQANVQNPQLYLRNPDQFVEFTNE